MKGDVLTIFLGMDSFSEWIIDSSCSHHMCPYKDWFTIYTSFNDGSVLIGNHTACKIIGIGTVKIKMFDGAVRTLTDVRHVPTWRKSLISLDTLDENGYSYSGSNGLIKVKKSTLVMIKGEKIGLLYKLIRKTITGDVAVTSSSDNDATLLWHARLGHMSKWGLLELHN